MMWSRYIQVNPPSSGSTTCTKVQLPIQLPMKRRPLVHPGIYSRRPPSPAFPIYNRHSVRDVHWEVGNGAKEKGERRIEKREKRKRAAAGERKPCKDMSLIFGLLRDRMEQASERHGAEILSAKLPELFWTRLGSTATRRETRVDFADAAEGAHQARASAGSEGGSYLDPDLIFSLNCSPSSSTPANWLRSHERLGTS
jgi:hypothetical protein